MSENILQGLSDALAGTVDRVGPSLVRVEGRPRQAATGIVWSTDGLIVTTDHVLEREDQIVIGLSDGREGPAQLVGRDPNTDLAVLKTDFGDLMPATWAAYDNVRIGELVLALGRPGATPMATIGIVSAKTDFGRRQKASGFSQGLIQTDVTMYPGFSGGALVNSQGQVLGINSSALARGISLAIPTETVRRVVEAVLSGGRVRRGYLGVSVQPVPLPPALAGRLGLNQPSGLLVMSTESDGPAEQSGIILGDILVNLGGQTITDLEDLQAVLGSNQVGSTVAGRIVRGGEMQQLSIAIGEAK